jgi:hypothetical protein
MYNHREPTYYEDSAYQAHPQDSPYSNPNNLFYGRQQMQYVNSPPPPQEVEDNQIFRKHEDPEMTPQHSMEGHYIPRNQWHQSQPVNQMQYSNYNNQHSMPHHESYANIPGRVHQSEYNMPPRVPDNGSQYNANPFNNYEENRAQSVHQMRHPQDPGFGGYNDRVHVGSTGMPLHQNELMGRPQSKRSLYMGQNNFLGSGDAHSVRSLQQNIFLNRYEDDCLYMNLEEEYLHKVSKRMGKSANVSINKSMYNFK